MYVFPRFFASRIFQNQILLFPETRSFSEISILRSFPHSRITMEVINVLLKKFPDAVRHFPAADSLKLSDADTPAELEKSEKGKAPGYMAVEPYTLGLFKMKNEFS